MACPGIMASNPSSTAPQVTICSSFVASSIAYETQLNAFQVESTPSLTHARSNQGAYAMDTTQHRHLRRLVSRLDLSNRGKCFGCPFGFFCLSDGPIRSFPIVAEMASGANIVVKPRPASCSRLLCGVDCRSSPWPPSTIRTPRQFWFCICYFALNSPFLSELTWTRQLVCG